MEKTSGEREFFKNFISRMLEEASFEEIKTVYFFVLNFLG